MHVLNTTITVNFVLPAEPTPPAEADLDIITEAPDGTITYIDDAILTYTPATASTQGSATYAFNADQIGRWKILLAIGTSASHTVESTSTLFVIAPITAAITQDINRKLRTSLGDFVPIIPTPEPLISYQATILADNPLSYWPLNDLSGPAVDLMGVNDGTYENSPLLDQGPVISNGEGRGVEFGASVNTNINLGSFAASSIAQVGDATWEFWCNVVIGAPNSFLGHNGGGEAEGANYLIRADLSSGGELTCFHEYGAGNNVSANSGFFLESYRDYHIVIVRDATAKTYAWWVNGVKVNEVGYSENPTGGSTGTSRLANAGTSGRSAIGVMDQFAVWDEVLPDARIIAHYDVGTTFANAPFPIENYPATIVADAPAGYWPMNEASGALVADNSVNGNDLTLLNSGWLRGQAGIVPGSPGATEFSGAQNIYAVSAGSPAILQILGDLTVECWVDFDTISLAGHNYIVSFGINGESLATNVLYSLSLEQTTGKMRYLHEYASGSNQIMTSSRAINTGKHHLAFTRDVSALTVTFWDNGVKRDVRTYTTQAADGSSGQLNLGAIFASADTMIGRLEHVSVYPAVLSDARIIAHASAIIL